MSPLLAVCFGMRACLHGPGVIPSPAPDRSCILTIPSPFSLLVFSLTQTFFFFSCPAPFFKTLLGTPPRNCCSLYQRIAWLHSSHSYLLPVTGGAVRPYWSFKLHLEALKKKISLFAKGGTGFIVMSLQGTPQVHSEFFILHLTHKTSCNLACCFSVTVIRTYYGNESLLLPLDPPHFLYFSCDGS